MRAAAIAFISEWKTWIQAAEVCITLVSIAAGAMCFRRAHLNDSRLMTAIESVSQTFATWLSLHAFIGLSLLALGWFLFLFDS